MTEFEFKWYVQKPDPIKAIELKERVEIEDEEESFVGEPGDYLIEFNGRQEIWKKERFLYAYEELTNGKRLDRKQAKQQKQLIDDIKEVAWDKTIENMTPTEQFRATQMLNELDACAVIKLDTGNKKIKVTVANWVRAYPQLDFRRIVIQAENWLVTKNVRKKNYAMFLNKWIERQV